MLYSQFQSSLSILLLGFHAICHPQGMILHHSGKLELCKELLTGNKCAIYVGLGLEQLGEC